VNALISVGTACLAIREGYARSV